VKPLAHGAFPVPVSTIDWLLSRESPAARYVTLRDLLGRPAKDLELRKAKQAFVRDAFVRDVLPLLRPALSSAARDTFPERRHDGGFWLTLVLTEIGGDRTVPELKHAADVLFARWERVFVSIEREGPADFEVPGLSLKLFPLVLRTLALLGFGDDPRILAVTESLARARVSREAAETGRTPLVKELKLYAAIDEERRSPAVRSAIEFIVGRLLAVEGATLFPAGLGVPCGAESDDLDFLSAFVDVGVPDVLAVHPFLERLASRADRRARWKLERGLHPALPILLEREGELSRWVTIRALGVLQRTVGLRMAGIS